MVKLVTKGFIYKFRIEEGVTLLGDVFDEFHTPIFVEFLQSVLA